MKQIFILSLFFALLPACVTFQQPTSLADAVEAGRQGQAIRIEPELAQELLKAKLEMPLLLEFSASWCQSCQDLKPSLVKAAAESRGRYIIAQVDLTGREGEMNNFGMRGSFPSFILKPAKDEEILRKYGTDTFASIKSWLNSQDRINKTGLEFSTDERRSGYKAVLVAGSSQNANFAKEVELYYRTLEARGLKAEEIACFYPRPDFVEFASDRKQYTELTPFLKRCRIARRDEILATIQASINQKPKSFYVYITSHGAAPIPAAQQAKYLKACISFAPALSLADEDSDCEATQDITPDSLAAVMLNSQETKKYVVLQGCYTGGFISLSDDARNNPSSLAKLPSITIMTASRSDRASFGCQAAAAITFYGYSLLWSLAGTKDLMEDLDWKELAKTVEQVVSEQESKLSIRRNERSLPQFFQSF